MNNEGNNNIFGVNMGNNTNSNTQPLNQSPMQSTVTNNYSSPLNNVNNTMQQSNNMNMQGTNNMFSSVSNQGIQSQNGYNQNQVPIQSMSQNGTLQNNSLSSNANVNSQQTFTSNIPFQTNVSSVNGVNAVPVQNIMTPQSNLSTGNQNINGMLQNVSPMNNNVAPHGVNGLQFDTEPNQHPLMFEQSQSSNNGLGDSEKKSKKKSHKLLFIIIGVIVAILIGVAVWFFLLRNRNSVSSNSDDSFANEFISITCQNYNEETNIYELYNFSYDRPNQELYSVYYSKGFLNENGDLSAFQSDLDTLSSQGIDASFDEEGNLNYNITADVYNEKFNIDASSIDTAKNNYEKLGYICEKNS